MKRTLFALAVAFVGVAGFITGYQRGAENERVKLYSDTMPKLDDSAAVAYLANNKSAQQIGGMLAAVRKGNARHNYTERQLQLCLFVWEVNRANRTWLKLSDGEKN